MSTSPDRPRRAAVIYNPVKADVARLRAAVAAAESSAGWAKSLWLATTIEEPGGGLAAQAVREGADVVLAAGGDGTVRFVGEALRNTGVPLALVPAGAVDVLVHGAGALTPARQGVRDGKHADLSPGPADASPRLPQTRAPSAGLLVIRGSTWSWRPLVDER